MSRNDLHIHSEFSDGLPSIRTIVEKAAQLNLETIAIIDHFWPSIGSQRGGARLIKKRRAQIEDMRIRYPDIRILDGAEVDINQDGTMASVDGGIDQFDIVIGSVHWSSSSGVWARAVEKAAATSSFQILGHFDAYLHSYDTRHGEIVAKALAENEIAIELNARYDTFRTDFLEMARDMECRFTIGSDAHSIREIGRLSNQIRLARVLELPLIEF